MTEYNPASNFLHEYECTRSDLPANADIPVENRHKHYVLAHDENEALQVMREKFAYFGEKNFTVKLVQANARAYQVMTRKPKKLGFSIHD